MKRKNLNKTRLSPPIKTSNTDSLTNIRVNHYNYFFFFFFEEKHLTWAVDVHVDGFVVTF